MITTNGYRAGVKEEGGTYGYQNPLEPFLPGGIAERKSNEVIFVESLANGLLQFRCSMDKSLL